MGGRLPPSCSNHCPIIASRFRLTRVPRYASHRYYSEPSAPPESSPPLNSESSPPPESSPPSDSESSAPSKTESSSPPSTPTSKKTGQEILQDIYAVFGDVDEESVEKASQVEGSRQWEAVQTFKSRQNWKGRFEPENVDRYKFEVHEERFAKRLRQIDDIRSRLPPTAIREKNRELLEEYVHQTCMIEGNSTTLHETHLIASWLRTKDLLHPPDSSIHSPTETLTQKLRKRTGPSISSQSLLQETLQPLLAHSRKRDELTEIRNSLLATHAITETGLQEPVAPVLAAADVHALVAFLMRAMALGVEGWGTRSAPGQYRALPIRLGGVPRELYPYAREVPGLMRGFYEWKDASEGGLHPVVHAVHVLFYFLSIRPFNIGNGRVGRALLQDSLVRSGYLMPLLRLPGGKKDFARLMESAAKGKTGGLVEEYVAAQWTGMRALEKEMGLAKGEVDGDGLAKGKVDGDVCISGGKTSRLKSPRYRRVFNDI